MNAHVSRIMPAAAAAAALSAIVSEPALSPQLGYSDFIVNRAGFLSAVSAAKRIIERGSTPILSNVRLIASDGVIIVIGTNEDIQLTHIVNAISTSGTMDITVAAAELEKMLKKSEAVEIKVSYNSNSPDRVGIMWGEFRINLVTLPSTDFPMMDGLTFTHSFSMSGGDLCSVFDGVRNAISQEETRYYLNGVFMHVREHDDRSIIFVTTDGHRLSKMWLDCPAGADFLMGYRDEYSRTPGVIIPRKMVNTFLALADKKKRPESIKIDVGLDTIRFSFDDVEIVSKLIDGTFPDYNRVIPTGNDGRAKANAGAIKGYLVALSAMIDANAVKLDFANDGLTLSMVDSEGNSGSGKVDSVYSLPGYGSPVLELGINVKYFMNALDDASPDGGDVEFELADLSSPILIRGTRANYLGVVMPVRV